MLVMEYLFLASPVNLPNKYILQLVGENHFLSLASID